MRILITLLTLCTFTLARADEKKPADRKATEFKPWQPKLILSKETTFITKPLTKSGEPDYSTALNQMLSKGVTPQNNANVCLVQVLGPLDDVPDEYFRGMGMQKPAKGGTYYISLDKHLYPAKGKDGDDVSLMLEQENQLSSLQWKISHTPWNAAEHPRITAWLKRNAKPLALAVKASKRSRYFSPVALPEVKPGEAVTLLSAPRPSAMRAPDVSLALVTRAMLKMGSAKHDEAWQDLLACHRLGRLIARGPFLIDWYCGTRLQHQANGATLVLLGQKDLGIDQIRKYVTDLRALPPMPSPAEALNSGERFTFLDEVRSASQRGLAETIRRLLPEIAKDYRKRDKPTDWNVTLRLTNRLYDDVVKAMKLKNRQFRLKACQQVQDEIVRHRIEAGTSEKFWQTWRETKSLSKARGYVAGQLLIAILTSSPLRPAQKIDRLEQERRNLELAFALAIYQHETKRYPEKLTDLSPKYLSTIPSDLYSDKELIYHRTKDGYLLYSVGENGEDEGGHTRDDENDGDDLRVQMPLHR